MNGELYKHYLQEYEAYAKMEEEPADQNAWIMLKWMADCSLDPLSQKHTYRELMEQLLRFGEKDLYAAIERGWSVARFALNRERNR